MKVSIIFRWVYVLFFITFLVSCQTLPSQQAPAQENDYRELASAYSPQELAQMLAPIALYPDALLSQILMASTYPIELIEADRWVKKNPKLKDDTLDAALLDKEWEPSVKAICHFPSILTLMSERIMETTNLGNAYLAQEAEVLAMVQELRAKAYAQGNLTSTEQQKVIVEREMIIIEPVDYRVIYVPYYDPFYVYGPWWYPAYRPYYWGPPGVSIGVSILYWPGFHFSFTFGNWSYFDWHNHYIYINVRNRPRFVRHNYWTARPGRWLHAPRHRRGVAYRDKATAKKFGKTPSRSRDLRHDPRVLPQREERDHQQRERTEREQPMRQRLEQKRPDRKRIEQIMNDLKRPEQKKSEQKQSGKKKSDKKQSDKKQSDKKQSDKKQSDKKKSACKEGGRNQKDCDKDSDRPGRR